MPTFSPAWDYKTRNQLDAVPWQESQDKQNYLSLHFLEKELKNYIKTKLTKVYNVNTLQLLHKWNQMEQRE